MGFRRSITPPTTVASSDLTGVLAGIGFNLAAGPIPQPNVEDSLLAASIEGMERDDLRVLAILTTWLGIHHLRVNADRLCRLMQCQDSPRVRAYWAAIAVWLETDRRLVRLTSLYDGPRLDLLHTGSGFHLRRRGEDPRFKRGPLCVPAGILRERRADVMTPSELARHHRAYRYRIAMGPSYRADMWTLLDAQPSLSPADLARLAYGSFATGWQVKRDWNLLYSSQ